MLNLVELRRAALDLLGEEDIPLTDSMVEQIKQKIEDFLLKDAEAPEKNQLFLAFLLNYAFVKGYLPIVEFLTTEKEFLVNFPKSHELAQFNEVGGDNSVTNESLIEEPKFNAETVSNSEAPTLHEAAAAGDLALVKYLIETKKNDVNARDYYGYTPLHKAAVKGHLEVIKHLIAKDGDLNIQNSIASSSFLLLCNFIFTKPKKTNFLILNIIAKNLALLDKNYVMVANCNNNYELLRIHDILDNSYKDFNFMRVLNNEKDPINLAIYMAILSSFLKTIDLTESEFPSYRDHFQNILTEVLCKFAAMDKIDEDIFELMCTVYNSSKFSKAPFLMDCDGGYFKLIYIIITTFNDLRDEKDQLLSTDEYNFIKDLVQHYLSVSKDSSIIKEKLLSRVNSILSDDLQGEKEQSYFFDARQLKRKRDEVVLSQTKITRFFEPTKSKRDDKGLSQPKITRFFLPSNAKPSYSPSFSSSSATKAPRI